MTGETDTPNTPDDFAPLWTRSDLQTYLNCSRTHVWQLIKAGIIPEPVKLGGAIRFIPEEVKQKVKETRLKPPQTAECEG